MGDAAKKVGNKVSSAMTGGALSTSGNGWAQGGSLTDVANDLTGGLAGKVMASGKIKVPGATPRAEWNLSGADGKLRSDLMLGGNMPAAAGQSQSVLNQLMSRATSQGPSQQANYLMDANQRNTQNQLGQAEEMGRGQMASATGQMAMRGGLDAGARERMGSQGGFQTLMNKQKIMNDSAGSNLNILAQDEAQKTGMMQALPSQLLSQAGFEQGGKQFDIANTLQTVGGKYDTDMREWGASQAAREQAKLANKKSGLLGLGIAGIL